MRVRAQYSLLPMEFHNMMQESSLHACLTFPSRLCHHEPNKILQQVCMSNFKELACCCIADITLPMVMLGSRERSEVGHSELTKATSYLCGNGKVNIAVGQIVS